MRNIYGTNTQLKNKTMAKNIKETKELLSFIFSIVYASAKTKGNFITNYTKYGGAVKKFPAAIHGIKDVPAELLDLTSDEVFELSEFIKEEFNLPNKDLEETIENVLDAAAKIAASILSLREVVGEDQ